MIGRLFTEADITSLSGAFAKAVQEWAARNMPGQNPPVELVVATLVGSAGSIVAAAPQKHRVRLASDAQEVLAAKCNVDPVMVMRYRLVNREAAIGTLPPEGSA